MFSIFINNPNTEKIKVNIYDFDSTETILKRYVSLLPSTNITLYPSYKYLKFDETSSKSTTETTTTLSITKENDLFFEADKVYNVSDIRDIISKISLSRITENEMILRLKSKFKYITKLDIICLWFITNTLEGESFSSLSKDNFIEAFNTGNMKEYLSVLRMRDFTSGLSTYETVKKYVEKSKEGWIANNRFISEQTKLYNKLSKYESPKFIPYKQEEVIEDLYLNLPGGESLYEIFNNISVSHNLPYICLYDGHKIVTKVKSNFSPPDEWIMWEPEGLKTLNFYILNVSLDRAKKDVKGIHTHEYYSQGVWQQNENGANYVRFSLNSEFESSEIIKAKLLNGLNKINYEVLDVIQAGIKGTFTLVDTEFNRALFLDFVCNNDIGNYFFFVEESRKSALKKPKFSMYFEPNQNGDFYNTLTITITPNVLSKDDTQGIKGDKWLDVRISRAKNLIQANSFISIFGKLFGYYNTLVNNIATEYTDLYKSLDFRSYTKKKEESKENKKTGKRLAILQKHDPVTFGNKYSKKCQKAHQPYLIDNPDKWRKKYAKVEEIGESLSKYGLMEWPANTGNWYACYPREKTDVYQNYIYPGLVSKDDEMAPCCFVNNQFSKEKGGLATYKAQKSLKTTEEGTDVFSFERPLGSKKLAPRGRFAELPYYVQLLAASVGYEKIEVKRKSFFPLLRYGVSNDPTSFVHCMERATNKNYDNMNLEEKRRRVKEVLNDLSNEKNSFLVVCRQEMYDYTYDEIRRHLSGEGAYINPDMFVNVFSKYYDCNIIIFAVDDNHPEGEVITPRYSLVHLPYKLRNRNTVVIVKMQNHDLEWGYQCEIVCKYINAGKFEFLFKKEDPFVDAVIQASSLTNIVYTVSPEGRYVKYTPSVEI